MKIKRFLQRIPRPVKGCLYVALVCVLVYIFYAAIRCYPLTLRQDFRRAERVNLVGPSKIVDQINYRQWRDENNLPRYWSVPYDDMIIGETEYGVCVFSREEDSLGIYFTDKSFFRQLFRSSFVGTYSVYSNNPSVYSRRFRYIEKAGDITVVDPSTLDSRTRFESYVENAENKCDEDDDRIIPYYPIYVFTEYKDVAYAEVTVNCTGTRRSEGVEHPFSMVCSGTATVIDAGVLRCIVECDHSKSTLPVAISSGSSSIDGHVCTVALYDTDGKLIAQEEIDLFSNREK